MNIVEFKNISKNYNSHQAVNDFSLTVEKGESVAILGHSGCGKTTVLRLLAGFIAPEAGSIIISGKTVSSKGRVLKEPQERNLGMVFQDLALWPHLTVEGNLEFGLKAKLVHKKERDKRISDVLQLVWMDKYAQALPSELSGGQQQRVALARALVLRPEALLMDEPLSNLDLDLNIQLRNEIIKLHQQIGFTLIYVTHDREEAYKIANRIVVMEDGQIRLLGSAEDVQKYFTKLSKSSM